MPKVTSDGFEISEQVTAEPYQGTIEDDPWKNDPLRQRRLRQAYEDDSAHINWADLCNFEEEPEVKNTVWELYGRLYESFAIFAGRSQWPMIRQVDVYGFFEEARLLNRGGPSTDENDGCLESPEPSPPASPTSAKESTAEEAKEEKEKPSKPPKVPQHPLTTQDVQQMIVQTIDNRTRSIPSRATSSKSAKQDSFSRHTESVKHRMKLGAPIGRAQFIEVMLRSANSLRGREPSTSVAFRRFTDRIISERILQPPLSQYPRGLTLMVGEVCDTLLARRKTIREAWERFGGSDASFHQLSQLLKLCDQTFTGKHIASIYALSRRPLIEGKKVMKGLAYDEFCEAISRLALIWTRSSRLTATEEFKWPRQPAFGQPVRQKAVSNRLEAFFSNLAQRMRPAVRTF